MAHYCQAEGCDIYQSFILFISCIPSLTFLLFLRMRAACDDGIWSLVVRSSPRVEVKSKSDPLVPDIVDPYAASPCVNYATTLQLEFDRIKLRIIILLP